MAGVEGDGGRRRWRSTRFGFARCTRTRTRRFTTGRARPPSSTTTTRPKTRPPRPTQVGGLCGEKLDKVERSGQLWPQFQAGRERAELFQITRRGVEQANLLPGFQAELFGQRPFGIAGVA